MYWACVPLSILSVNWLVNSEFPCNVLGQDILSKLCISWQCSLNVLTRKTGVCPQCVKVRVRHVTSIQSRMKDFHLGSKVSLVKHQGEKIHTLVSRFSTLSKTCSVNTTNIQLAQTLAMWMWSGSLQSNNPSAIRHSRTLSWLGNQSTC